MLLSEMELNTVLITSKDTQYHVKYFLEKFERLGIKKGDTICVHSQLFLLGAPACRKHELLSYLCKILLECIGENGTLIMPAFTYSFCRKEVFDVRNTPSTVGILTEYFRQLPDTDRTVHPIFSFAVYGKRKKEFLDIGLDAFDDKNSVYGKMLQSNDKILLLGAPRGYTFYYLAEQSVGVSHRFYKHFTGEIIDGDKRYCMTVPYYVRHLDMVSAEDEDKVNEYLTKQKIQTVEALCNGSISMFECRSMFECCTEKIKQDETFFLKK